MTTKDKYFEIAEKVFKEIENYFPDLTMEYNYDDEFVQLSLNIPKQKNLDFDINLNLQNQDELHIATNYFCCEYFPADADGISKIYFENVVGIISGEYRILQFVRKNNVYKSFLQKPDGEKWKTIYKHFIGIHLPRPWLLVNLNKIQNKRESKLIPIYK